MSAPPRLRLAPCDTIPLHACLACLSVMYVIALDTASIRAEKVTVKFTV